MCTCTALELGHTKACPFKQLPEHDQQALLITLITCRAACTVQVSLRRHNKSNLTERCAAAWSRRVPIACPGAQNQMHHPSEVPSRWRYTVRRRVC